MLHSKHGSCAAVACLNLVVDQQHTVLIQQRFNLTEIRRGRHDHASIPLNRLNDHRRNGITFLLQYPFQALKRHGCGLFQSQLRMIRPLNKRYILVQIFICSPHLQSGYTHRQIGPSVQPAL
ncbi:hypothetical protein D3C75_924940 [compost metagenome]